MKRLAKPRRQTAKERKAGAPLDFSATPEELAMLGEYNRIDTLMLMEVIDRIGLLSDSEQALWQLDQLINERGPHVDVGLIEAGLSIGEEARIELHRELAELTGGTVTTPKQRDRILRWLKEHGCTLSNLAKDTVADALLESTLTAPARALLELRRNGAGAAALKFKTLLRWTDRESAEPRIRHAYRFHGASSGRWTSLGCQLHNLRKPELEDVQSAIDAVATGSLAEMYRRGFDRPLETIGHITRAVITAAPGKQLFIADLSGIEARGAAHVVGATDELEQWREFDRTNKPEDEPYFQTGITTFGQSPATARKTGKTGTLAFKYQGGIGAYRRITGDTETPDEIIAGRRDAWRRDHPEHAGFWGLALLQAVQAIQYPGQEFTAKAVAFQFDSTTGFLEVTLPSGRKLTYPQARLIEDEQRDTISFTFLDASGSRTGRMYHERRGSGAFGGLLLENITQALCRDIFIERMPRLEAAGYHIVMHTHDEYCCEVPEGFGSLDEFLVIITTPPSWAPDLPIAAKGRISDRLIEINGAALAADNAIDNAAQDLAERDELARVLCEQDEIDETTPELESTMLESTMLESTPELVSIPATARELWDGPSLAAQATQFPSPEPPPSPPMPPPPSYGGPGEGIGAPGTPDPGPAPGPTNGRGDGRDGYPHGEDTGPAAGPPVAEYLYKDAAGRLHMRVVRRVDSATGKKNFPTYHWENGDWVLGWPDKVVPYRLLELEAAPADVVVLICEGEKGADVAARHGFITTTHPGGAGKWQSELAQYFVGREKVCIVEDHDISGQKNTAAILKALRDVVPVIGVLRFPELPEGGDSTDFFARGGTAQALRVRIDEALKAGIARPYTLTNLDEVPFEETIWLWLEHLPVGGLVLITGVTGVGKTFALADIIARITTGRDWPDGAKGVEPGTVIALIAEDQDKEFRRRLMGAGADLTRIKIFKYVRRNERNELFLIGEDLDKLEMACIDLGDVRLITIDPITAYMGSARGFDSHRATDVRSQLAPLKDLAERLNVCIAAITHPSKGASSRAAIDAFIGSQAFIATARVGKYLVEELGEADDRGFRRPTGRILFTTPKNSDGPKPPTLAFRQEDIVLDYVPGTDRLIKSRHIVWNDEPVDLTADEARIANTPTSGSARGDGRKARAAPVRDFLREILTDEPMLQRTVVERGAEKGFSLDQLKRALKDKAVNGRAFRRKNEGRNSPWWWALPKHVPADAEINEENEKEQER
jgi:DNA polymerase